MSWLEIIAERKIQEAYEEGVFDHLPGQGKPLNLEIDPRVPPEQRAAYRLMKEARVLPDWIQLYQEIAQAEARWETCRSEFFRRREERLAAASGSRAAEARLDYERDRFLREAAEALARINGLIERYNLMVPVASKQRCPLVVPDLLRQLEEALPRFHPLPDGAPPLWEEAKPPKPALRLSNRLPRRRRRGMPG